MELTDMINELKKGNNKYVFDNVIDKILFLIYDEIGDYSLPYTWLLDLDENIEYKNKELERFINSETDFKDLIDGNIKDLESFRKVVKLVKALGEMQIRKQDSTLFDSNICSVFNEELDKSLDSGLETNDEFYKIYAELIPYICLDRNIIMNDWEKSINIIKEEFAKYEDEYWGIDYDTTINKEIIEFIYKKKEEYLTDILLKENKTKEDGQLFQRIRENSIKEVMQIKLELKIKDPDKEKILTKLKQLSNPIFFGELFFDDYIIDEINDIFLELDENETEIYSCKEYKKFQDSISRTIINNAVNDGILRERLLSINREYLEQILDKKICLFSEEGRTIKNYLEFVDLYPQFDKNELSKKIKDSYGLEKIDFVKEKSYINDYISKNKIVTNEEEFDEFLNHLQLIKLKDNNFSLPIDYVDFVIKQALESDSVISKNPDKYLNLVECCIADLGKNTLKIDTPYNYIVADYVRSNITEAGKANGTCNHLEKKITISREYIIKMIKEKNIEILNTVFHENEHAEQFDDFLNTEINSYNRYIMQKEEILGEVFGDFYKENYDLTYIEIEANEKAARKLANYLDMLNISDNSSLMFFESIGEEIANECQKIVNRKRKDYKKGEEKIIQGRQHNIVEMFDNVIRNYPELIDKYSQLLIEYNKDGSKRNLRQIIDNAEIYIKGGYDLNEIITKIIRNGRIITEESIIEDIEVLMQKEPKNEYEKTFIKNIISENISKVIFDIINNIDKFDYEQLISYKQMIEEIDSRMRC